MRLSEILAMPHSAERNLALRRFLELREGEVGLVTLDDAAQVVVASEDAAVELAGFLRSEPIAGWSVTVTVRPDGRWLVWGRFAV